MTPQEELYWMIPLTRGKNALASLDDWMRLMAFEWHALWQPSNNSFYAVRMIIDKDGNRRQLSMHREVMGLSFGDKGLVDHINHDTLDNRRSNLRIVTHAQNKQNSRCYKNNKSGYKGVSFHAPSGQYFSRIKVNGISIHLGYRLTAELSYGDYCKAALKYFGDYACLT
jgi:hypothetical protein